MPPETPLRIDLVFDSECPHLSHARAVLRDALTATGIKAEWHEWDREHAATPEEFRRFGSPTILVNGADVADAEANHHAGARCCRVYPSAGRLLGAPPVPSIVKALTAVRRRP